MDVNIYEACDKAIKAMNRENLEAFGRLKGMDWDEVNIIRTVKTVYAASAKRARKRYYEVGFEAYLLAMVLCEEDAKKAHRMAEKAITEQWVKEILTETDLVTLYRFESETERKAYRLAEALEVPEHRNYEIDKALKIWSQQVGQYAINVTDYAVVQAFMDAGVEEVIWVAREDQRVCGDCYSLNGRKFKIDEVPVKHWGCRCSLKPVLK